MQEIIAALRDPQEAGALLLALAPLAIVAGGFSLMFSGLRRFAARLLVLGAFLAGAAAIVPNALPASTVTGVWSPDWIVVCLVVAGGSALILGAVGIGVILLLPAAILYVVVPIIEPELARFPSTVTQGIVAFAVILGAILILKIIVQLIYGKQAAGHVAGTYLVRTLDAFGRWIGTLVGFPFRFWRRMRGE